MSWSEHGCFDLRGINLTAATLGGANFVGTNVDHAVFRGAKLLDADFQGAASCRYTIFEGADLLRATLQRIDATGARFEHAHLHKASLDGAVLTGAAFVGADMRDAKLLRVSAARADFRNAYLAKADLEGADLTNVSFDGADVSWANFGSSNLKGASFVGANGTDSASFNSALALVLSRP